MGKSLKFLEIIFYDPDSIEGRLILKYFSYFMIFGYFLFLIPVFIASLYFFELIFSLILFLGYTCIHLLFYPKFRDYFDFDDL